MTCDQGHNPPDCTTATAKGSRLFVGFLRQDSCSSGAASQTFWYTQYPHTIPSMLKDSVAIIPWLLAPVDSRVCSSGVGVQPTMKWPWLTRFLDSHNFWKW